MPAEPGARLESRLAAVKSELKITAEQEAAWQAYAGQMKTQAESMISWMTTMRSAPPATASERIDRHTAMLKQRAAMAEETGKAVKGLYEVMTPEQRELAEQRLFAMGPGFGRGPGWRNR